jgi:hypothetical protein
MEMESWLVRIIDEAWAKAEAEPEWVWSDETRAAIARWRASKAREAQLATAEAAAEAP